MMTRTDLDLAGDRIADAVPQAQALLARLTVAACHSDHRAVGGTLDDLRSLIEGIAADGRHLLTELEAARLHAGPGMAAATGLTAVIA
jgi:hypothetical protein